MGRKIKQEVVCQKSEGALLSPQSSHSEKYVEREPSLMECALTICAVLYIPYGHEKKPNGNNSIGVFPHSTHKNKIRFDVNAKTCYKCSNTRQLFGLKTQSSRSSVMLFR